MATCCLGPVFRPAAVSRHRNRSYYYETYLPAFRYPPQAQPRFPCPYEDEGRPRRDQRPSRQRPRSSLGVSRGARDPLAFTSFCGFRGFPRLSRHPASLRAGAAFPRDARLLESDDFARALKTRAQRGKLLWVYRRAVEPATAQPLSDQRPQLGLMIGKRFARTAVLRNAIKRRIREQFRLRQGVLPPLQFVARLNAPVSTKDVGEVVAEWVGVLDREARRDSTRTAK